MKLAVVGGGSTYTPELVDGIARLQARLPVSELALTDPAADRLALVGGLAARMFAREGHPGKVVYSVDPERALDGADFVLIQLRVGGQSARNTDETLPLQCGCAGQETTGAGGLAKALRTVPVVLDLARRVRARAAPGAWIVDFTNPVGIVTRALLDAGHRAVGLCNVAIGYQRQFAKLLDVHPGRLRLDHVGLNHLTWERRVLLDGTDVLAELLTDHGPEIADRSGMAPELMRRLGVVPSYYLRYFYAHDAVVEEQRAAPSRARTVADIESRLLEAYADETLDTKPALLEQRGGAYYSDAAVDVISALAGAGGSEIQVVDIRNDGALPFLPDEAVVEIPARVDPGGARPDAVDPVDPLFAGLISHVAAYESLAVEAATGGGRDRVFRALLAHPLIGQVETAERLTDLLIEANRKYLPWAR